MLEKLKALKTSLLLTLTNIKAKASQDLKDIWAADKGFFILFGGIILTIKFRQLLINLIVSSSKALFKSAQKESDKDQAAENQANQQADQLVKDAQELPKKEEPVGDDWNTK